MLMKWQNLLLIELTSVIFWPFNREMQGEIGPLTFSYAIPRDTPFLVYSRQPVLRSTFRPMTSPFLELVVYYSTMFLWIFWPLRHIMPHSLGEDPR